MMSSHRTGLGIATAPARRALRSKRRQESTEGRYIESPNASKVEPLPAARATGQGALDYREVSPNDAAAVEGQCRMHRAGTRESSPRSGNLAQLQDRHSIDLRIRDQAERRSRD